MNALTVEIQNLETRRGNQSFTSLQIASRVPLLVKDPDGISMETQCLPNDVHTLRLDLSPKEVRHIAYNMKSRHLKGGVGLTLLLSWLLLGNILHFAYCGLVGNPHLTAKI